MKDVYENPLCSRYASEKMQHRFSPQWKFSPFRRLRLALAESEQAAQPTPVGKRATLWLQDFLLDLERLEAELARLPISGCKGATGTAASFLALFRGDAEKVLALEKKIAEKMGVPNCIPVAGQTYTRKLDSFVMNVLSGIAQSAAKMATDMRLLAHLRELDEPFEAEQVGSYEMAFKRKPMS